MKQNSTFDHLMPRGLGLVITKGIFRNNN